MPHTLLSSTQYKKFVSERDKALEQIHQHAQMDISHLTSESLKSIEGLVATLATRHEISVSGMHYLTSQVEFHTTQILSKLFSQLVSRVKRMRKAVFTLTYTSELEAVARATGQKISTPPSFAQKLKAAEEAPTLRDESLEKRVWYSLMKLRAKVVQALNLALVQELSPSEVLAKVVQVFPQVQSYKRPPRELKPFREADTKRDKEIYDFAFIDDADWKLAVDAYKDTELPPSRFDNAPSFDNEAGYQRYNWEVEQELTDDFVHQVRDGQVEAARDAGIQEFVWVAILDDRTDDCCQDRNGHTTSEIEAMLDSGDLDGDSCDAVTPPAHPNCRCQLAPVASTEQVEGPDWKSFNEWLES
jgi:hypothetical protein